MAVETMPVIGIGDRVPSPVGALGIEEDHARTLKALIGVAPYVVVPRRRSRFGTPCTHEPRMLVGGMVDHQLGHDSQAALVAGVDEAPEVSHRPVGRVNFSI